MTRFLKRVDTLLDEKPLAEWARVRWADLALSIYWLHDRKKEPWLLDLAAKVRKQGLDWPKFAYDFPHREKVTVDILGKFKEAAGGHWINDMFGSTHGVNVGMGVKAPGVWSRQSGRAADRRGAQALLTALDRYHGQATGMFSCDEHLAGKHPSQGTELCTVMELMFSLENLLAIAPEMALADRLESIAYNALPATFSDDMWAHQYDQQVNQVVCKISPERIYSNNGPEANLFGLEPTFGCCLANMHQGWPKLVSHLWMKPRNGGLIAMTYAPCEIKTRVNNAEVRLIVRTDYPFNETIEIDVRTPKPARFPITLRIPAWAEGASFTVSGDAPTQVGAGTFHRIDRRWANESAIRLTLPMRVRVERRFNDSITAHRGPLVFGLRVGQDWRKLREKKPTADWEVHPTTPWNYALQVDLEDVEKSFRVVKAPVAKSPFSPDAPAIRLVAKGRRVTDWQLVKNAADAPPQSPVTSREPLEEIELVPYGSAKLRVTEIPVLAAE